jgi:aquaporin Z
MAEYIMAGGMMSAVLYFSNHHRLARYTGSVASLLVAIYITVEPPLSGMSINPATPPARLPRPFPPAFGIIFGYI